MKFVRRGQNFPRIIFNSNFWEVLITARDLPLRSGRALEAKLHTNYINI